MSFTLHPQLAADTFHVGDLEHCRVSLMNNANFPWLILVPMEDGLREITDLKNYAEVMDEVKSVIQKFQTHTNAHKMNVAALGNVVPQLHIHIIARFDNDAAWPAPVWGAKAEKYTPEAAEKLKKALQRLLSVH
jgi:diadenosine tetraphosphate (Ap4A) HIT family hydrolase